MRRLGTLSVAMLLLCAARPAAATDSAAEKMERLERQIDELRQEIQELKKQQAPPPRPRSGGASAGGEAPDGAGSRDAALHHVGRG
jgi:cell division protein FtsB